MDYESRFRSIFSLCDDGLPKDENGQPPARLNRTRRIARDASELTGFLSGILADGKLTDEEIHALARILLSDREQNYSWIWQTLVNRLAAALEDGRIDEDERADLKSTIEEILGSDDETLGCKNTTRVPLTKPEPEVIFDGNVFVFTGAMAWGSRKKGHQEVCARGGRCAENITLQTNYLVLGTTASRDWLNPQWGRKIETAVEYSKRSGLYIITERRFVEFL